MPSNTCATTRVSNSASLSGELSSARVLAEIGDDRDRLYITVRTAERSL
jgi:hypothetical protein